MGVWCVCEWGLIPLCELTSVCVVFMPLHVVFMPVCVCCLRLCVRVWCLCLCVCVRERERERFDTAWYDMTKLDLIWLSLT